MGQAVSTAVSTTVLTLMADHTFQILILDSTKQICQLVANGPSFCSYMVDGKRIHVYFASHGDYCSTALLGFSYCHKFDGIIIAQNYTKKQLENSKLWVEKINRYASTDACKLFVGVSNDDESDEVEKVKRTTLEQYAVAMGFPFMDLSTSQTKWQWQPIMKVVDDVYWKKSQLQNAEKRTE